ncbi:MAG: hypothetical protein ACK5AV_00945 [Alphaproteobacteria bacterium]|jgi:hypothetical protein|nr:hypothetical protein [Candidatus Jidaibacter sp.]
MKINKFNFVDFKDFSKNTEQSNLEDLLLKAANDPKGDIYIEHSETVNPNVKPVSEESQEISDQPLTLHDEVKPEVPSDLQAKILEQNEHIQATLMELRSLLVTIEKQQESNLLDVSKKCAAFASAITTKIFRDIKFKDIVQSVMIVRINDVINRFADLSTLNISIPKLSNTFKKDLIESIKTTANKLNIEITEHEEESSKVGVTWENGKVEINIDETLDEIDREVRKIDTTT